MDLVWRVPLRKSGQPISALTVARSGRPFVQILFGVRFSIKGLPGEAARWPADAPRGCGIRVMPSSLREALGRSVAGERPQASHCDNRVRRAQAWRQWKKGFKGKS